MSVPMRKQAAIVLASTLGALCVADASAQVANLAVFSATGVNVGQTATVTGGVVATNGDMVLGPHSNVAGLLGGGNLTSTATQALITSSGSWIFGGNVDLGADVTVAGNIDAGGFISLTDRPNVNGDLTSNAGVSLRLSGSVTGTVRTNGSFSNGGFNVFNGNVHANQNVTVDGTVNGDVRYGQTLTVGPFGSITGARVQGPTQATPTPYTPRTLPSATLFTAGGTTPSTGGTAQAPLQPGSYGHVVLPKFTDLYLAPGEYRFESLTLAGSQAVHYTGLTGSNAVNILVAGDVNVGTFVDVSVNGQTFATADKSLASRVLIETHGDYVEDPLSTNEIFGTLFAPQGTISLGQFVDMTGALLASGPITTAPGLDLSYVPHATLIPEPGSAAMLSLAVSALVRRRRRG